MGSKSSPWANLFAHLLARPIRLFEGRGRYAVLALIAAAVIVLGPYFAWRKWGPELTGHERFRVTAEKIETTPQPAWIHSDVRAEVVRDGSLEDLAILDEQVTVKVASAFALHHWVAAVKRVSKHPGPKILVELEYRRPVAMVEIASEGTRGLLPIDATGVLLPTEDFSPNQTRNYLRISAGDSMPAGLVGSGWGDDRIVGAARLAVILESSWRRIGLYRIAVHSERDSVRRKSSPVYELQSRQGSRIIWGHAPGLEVAGEAGAAEKLARLEEFVERNRPLDAGHQRFEIDLREGQVISLGSEAATLRPAANGPASRD